MTTRSSLSGQVILITGATSGIGKSLAQSLANNFADVCLILTGRNPEKLQAIVSTCQAANATVFSHIADLTNPEQIKELVDFALKSNGRVDCLINNAGYGQMGPVELVQTDQIERQFQVNVIAPIALSQALIPIMRHQGSGRIINISSVAGRFSFPFAGVYCASKYALEALTDALRMELAHFNIKVISIEPGPVDTEFFEVATQTTLQAIPAPDQTPYAAALKHSIERKNKAKTRAWSPDRVANIIIKAITDSHPNPRYVASDGGSAAVFFMSSIIPTPWLDRFWQNLYGINLITQTSKE